MKTESKTRRTFLSQTELRYALIITSFILGMVIFRVFFQFSFSLTIIWKLRISINFAALLVYYVWIMFRPAVAFSIVSLGLLFGDGLYCLIYGCGGELPIYLAISLISYGGMVLIISFLRKKNILLPYFTGTVWYYFGFMLPSYIYYLVFYDAYAIMVFAGSLINTIIHVGFVPIAMLLIYLTRKYLKIRFFDEIIQYEKN